LADGLGDQGNLSAARSYTLARFWSRHSAGSQIKWLVPRVACCCATRGA